MGLHFKAGVDLRHLSTQALVAWLVATEVYEEAGYRCWLTSAYRSGTRDQVLLHGEGEAIDLGLRDDAGRLLPADVIDLIVAKLELRLGRRGGGQFDVVDERHAPGGPHLHIEFDPKETTA